ncbi:hypothetical protein BH24GEM1_BH24GEM1_20150 [soil metagenome]
MRPPSGLTKELYERHRAGAIGEACLRQQRLLACSLAQIDKRCSLDRALEYSQELLRRLPESATEWHILGAIQLAAGRCDEALQSVQTARAINPNDPQLWYHVGHCSYALGDQAQGRAAYQWARDLTPDPTLKESDFNPWLRRGDYDAGWRDWAQVGDRLLGGGGGTNRAYWSVRPLIGRPVWKGDRIAGRLLVNFEHGHGDAFMMLRWIPELLRRVGALRLQVNPEQLSLVAAQWPNVDVVPWSDDPGGFECCTLSFSLPHLFGVKHPDDVRAKPYLRAVGEFRPLEGAFRVGLRWAGNPGLRHDLLRSTELSAWKAVLDVPGVTFYSLQLGSGAEQLSEYAGRIHDLGPELTDWAQTAAAMMQLDLVISVDTSVAHLAGALGRPVWICLPSLPEWRWMLDQLDTPWYGSARLFRQERVGDWSGVFAEVAAALADCVRAAT